MERKEKDHVMLWFEENWVSYNLGDEVPLRDGIFLGKDLSAVIFGGHLVAAWEGRNYVVPHGSPRDWDRIRDGTTSTEDMVAHIPMSALQEGAKRENLDWEKDCVPRMSKLIEKLTLQIEPIHFCMIACRKFKREMEEGIIT